MEKIQVRISKNEADEQQAHGMIPKIERYTDTLKQALTIKAKTKSLTRMPAAEKAMKERDRTQMPVAKKERTDHKCLWQRKKERPNHKCWWQTKNGCPNQASKQLTPNERNKTAETT